MTETITINKQVVIMYKHTTSLGGAYVTPVLKTVSVQTQVGFAASPESSFSRLTVVDGDDYEM